MNKILELFFKKTQRGMMRKLSVIAGLLQENSYIAITWNPESNCTCREELFLLLMYIDVTRTTLYIIGCCFRQILIVLERRWRKRIIRCMHRLHKFNFIERKAT